MDKQKAAAEILAQALPMIVFDGWNHAMLQKAALAAGYKKTDVIRVFPGGAIDAVDFFIRAADGKMLSDLKNYHLESMKIRERIALCVRVRLESASAHREAIRKAIALHAIPIHMHRAISSLYHTVDLMWIAAGDTATDFNFYSKRALLASVYSTTLLHFIDDKSPGFENTWAFLDRRIAEVMYIEKAKFQIKHWLKNIARQTV